MDELKHKDYILKKKYKLLYYLYERLYGLVKLTEDDVCEWELYEASDGFNSIAEIKKTKILSLNQKIKLHKYHYKRLRNMSSFRVGVNGFYELF